ncbi:hypothetical protein [Xanthomonas albilineans]|uniref:hypothetical protein n=1 Tax=Xanthomonas albilineans TaxID=29447 RepID=UPI000B0FDF6B|nr:hypothetical protein [Xanthomonas albilineans]
MSDVCECGRPIDRLHGLQTTRHACGVLSESDRQALADALCEAFEKSAPVLSQAMSDALQAQFERVIGRGVVGWTKRILIAGLLALAGYTFTKSGGFK